MGTVGIMIGAQIGVGVGVCVCVCVDKLVERGGNPHGLQKPVSCSLCLQSGVFGVAMASEQDTASKVYSTNRQP